MGAEDFFNVTDDGYQFSGNDSLAQFAEEELRETESLRSSSLQQLREAIHKHPDIKKCRTGIVDYFSSNSFLMFFSDSIFLLRFLRTKKFSVPLALEMLERYLVIRQLYPNWFRQLDVEDQTINDILDSGYLVPLPLRFVLYSIHIRNCEKLRANFQDFGNFQEIRYLLIPKILSGILESFSDKKFSLVIFPLIFPSFQFF